MRFSILTLALGFLCFSVNAQSTAFIFKGGPSIGTQKWDNSIDRELLFKYHGAIAIETVNNDDDRNALYAQFGYHIKGSASRFRNININNPFDPGNVFTQTFEFENLSLQVGAKQKQPLGEMAKWYYFGGLRGEYTLSTNLGDVANLTICAPGALPLEGGERDFLFGFTLGGGIELAFGELVGGILELSVHPDVTPQYFQPPINNVIDPCTPGVQRSIPERRIRNTTIEISLGLRLLRKVVYID